MKVTPTTPPNSGAAEGKKATAAREGARAAGAAADDATGALGEVQGRDFASVLEEVSRADERRDSEAEGDRRDSKRPEKGEHEAVERREQEQRQGGDREAGGGGGFGRAHASAREIALPSETAGARAILHVADLERIVSAVRTQLLPAGQHEVTIELRRSVLEGLQVKLRMDADRRVTAEFIAASERVRAQIDARSGELAEILRARGVNLAALSTTTAGSDTHGRNQAGGDSSHSEGGVTTSAGARVGDAPRAAGGADEDEDTGATYRA